MGRITANQRGIASVLAMLYLVLFSVLAVGFYAATSTAVQVVGNEQRASQALLAAESGMDFIRYQLAQVTIPHGTSPEDLFAAVFLALEEQLNDTGNISSIGWDGQIISIPSGANSYVRLDDTGAGFRAQIENLGQKVRVKVIGRCSSGSVRRAIQLDYGLAQRASAIFDYGVASKGKVTTSGSARIRGASDPKKGSVLSACWSDPTPVVIDGKEVSGDISIVNPAGNVTYAGASVGGTSNPIEIALYHIHKGVPEPEFPTVDTSAFEPFATNTYRGGNELVNCRIPAGTNPRFTGRAVIRGVLFVETPNKLDFRGNVEIQGLIVVQNNPTGDPSSNVISFGGDVSASPVDTLPESYGELRKLTGSFILAPSFNVTFTGNFGTVGGSILASQVQFSGNAKGTVMGSVIGLEDRPMTVGGSSEVIIASTGTSNYPSGVFFSSHYVPLPDTYLEVLP